LSLQFADPVHRARPCRATAWRAGCAPRWSFPAALTVRIVGADEGRALNRDYRGRTTPPTC
jgi:probable rRNA maturation factor